MSFNKLLKTTVFEVTLPRKTKFVCIHFTRSSALPILSVDHDLSTCLPPSSLSERVIRSTRIPLSTLEQSTEGFHEETDAKVDSIDCLLRNYRAV